MKNYNFLRYIIEAFFPILSSSLFANLLQYVIFLNVFVRVIVFDIKLEILLDAFVLPTNDWIAICESLTGK